MLREPERDSFASAISSVDIIPLVCAVESTRSPRWRSSLASLEGEAALRQSLSRGPWPCADARGGEALPAGGGRARGPQAPRRSASPTSRVRDPPARDRHRPAHRADPVGGSLAPEHDPLPATRDGRPVAVAASSLRGAMNDRGWSTCTATPEYLRRYSRVPPELLRQAGTYGKF